MKRKNLAQHLFQLYRHALITRIHFNAKPTTAALVDQPPAIRKAFRAVAADVSSIEADPRKYILAQFVKFEQYSQWMKKKLVPQPNQLYGLGAMARYAELEAEAEETSSRKSVAEDKQLRKFYRETRKLKGLCRVFSKPPSDILVETPEEFTPEFLRHRGVWDLVQEVYEDRVA